LSIEQIKLLKEYIGIYSSYDDAIEFTNKDLRQLTVLDNKLKDLAEGIEFSKMFDKEEDCTDSTKGECPLCTKGLVNVDIDNSFVVTLKGFVANIEIERCDRCEYISIGEIQCGE